MPKRQSRKGKQLRQLADSFARVGGRRWSRSVKRLRREAADADKRLDHRRRAQFRRLEKART